MKHELEALKFIEENYDKIHANDKVPITSLGELATLSV